jgi:acetoacetyl-CoA synthetase
LGQQNDLVFVHRAFDDPLYILFSSGTTGVPKCIVHGVGGTLLQHKKELMLHTDLGPGDRLFYYTTCGWMMWNWMVSALSVDASLYVYDGSPNAPDFSSLWQTIQDEKITVFGTSPKYIAYSIGQGMCPKEDYELSQLRTILSTGAPLLPEHFQWIYNAVDGDIHLASISGGTDIVSCFMLGNPLLPVRSGEIQGPGLGMAIEAWDSEGKPTRGAKGELVCVKPFPSMPLYFWKDSDGSKIREAYFSHYPQCEVWRHGDFVELTDWGGVIVYGRSDATLNPGGVRIGTAELYRQVESMPEVAEAVAVARKNNGDVDILLFVKLNTGFTMDEILDKKIRHTIRTHLTPRHLPKQIFAVTDIPYTRSGKKMEMVVSCIMNQESIDQFTAISNPESLPQYFKIQHELKEKR